MVTDFRSADGRSGGPHIHLSQAAEFGYPAGLDPLDYEDVAGVIEAGAVGADESAGDEGSGSLIADSAPVFSGVFGFAQGCYHIVLAVEDDYLAEQVGDYDFSVALLQIARHLRGAED